jgi:dCMP deaminase
MRTDIPDWVDYFYVMALHAATRSKDPSTQVGAVIVKDNQVMSTGYNGFAPGVMETEERWSRPQKYERVIHAEVNAIAAAAKAGHSTNYTDLYVTHYPCSNCCRLVIAAGIERVFTAAPPDGWDHKPSEWMFKEAGVRVIMRKTDASP